MVTVSRYARGMDPENLLVDYEAKLAEVQRRAEHVREGLVRTTVTDRSTDGHISVTVNASGNVVGLKLADAACDQPGAELAEAILRTIARAQSELAGAVRATMAPELAGSELLAELDTQYRTNFPEPPPDTPRPGRRTLRIGAEDDHAVPTEQPTRRPRQRPDDDVDYGDRNLLR